jgi:hypothetical protein
MISDVTGSVDGEINSTRLKASADGWLSLAAAPVFAVMALLTKIHGGAPNILCSATPETWPLTGMVPMYLLMSAFHLTPWLKLLSNRKRRALARGGIHE